MSIKKYILLGMMFFLFPEPVFAQAFPVPPARGRADVSVTPTAPATTPSTSPTDTPVPSPTVVVLSPTQAPLPEQPTETPLPQATPTPTDEPTETPLPPLFVTFTPTPTPLQEVQAIIERQPTPTPSPEPVHEAAKAINTIIQAPVSFLARSFTGSYYQNETLSKISSILLTLFSGFLVFLGFLLLNPPLFRTASSRFRSFLQLFFS